MDLLEIAVVDITTLTATYRALDRGPFTGALRVRHKLRDKLRTELKSGIGAYIDTLARSKRGVLDGNRLALCRLAAEVHMTRALQHQQALGRLMQSAPGCLLGVAAARQDLWRLVHMLIHLRPGVAALRASGGELDREAVKRSGVRLRGKLTRALVAYARARQGSDGSETSLITVARRAALRAVGTRGTAEAESLVQRETALGAAHTLIRTGVVKPMADLFLDWSELQHRPDSGGATFL